jgi:ATP-dependent RNA helicase DDX21
MSHRPRADQRSKRGREENGHGDGPKKPAAPKAIAATRPSDDETPVFEGSVPLDQIEEVVKVALHPLILKQLREEMKFEYLFPIQVKTLAAILEGNDIVARARTGSGKTLGFALPVVHNLMTKPRKDRKQPYAICLSPTRELAMQSHKVFESLIPKDYPLKSIAVYGGLHISLQKSEIMNSRGLDIVVGTTGRFLDFLKSGTIKLDSVKMVILDEADRMLDEGFADDVEKIMGGLPEKAYQLLLFSATLPEWVDGVVKRFGHDPSQRTNIDLVGHNTVSVSETVAFYELLAYSREEKLMVMGDLIRVYAGRTGRVIIFTATKAECHDMGVSSVLRDNQTLHGDMKQEEREKTMQAFRDGKFSTLIATDVASRGLDIPRVDLVIQTTVPTDSDSFVHRAGRTGRAGRRGVCIVIRNRYDNIYRLAQKCGITFQPLTPPTQGEVMTAISRDIAESIETVDPTVQSWFSTAATTLLGGKSHEECVEVVSKALALLAGYSKKEKTRSLIGNRLGASTLIYQSTDKTSYYFRRLALGAVLGHIDEVVGPGVGRTCRHVTVCGEGSPTGVYAVFDMDDAEAEKVANAFKTVKDMRVEIIQELPSDYKPRADLK